MTTDNFYSSMSKAPADTNNRAAIPGDDFAKAQSLFGGTANASSVLNDPNADMGQNLAAVESNNEGWRQSLNAVELSDAAGAEVTRLVRQFGATPPTAAEQADWARETNDSFSRAHGPVEGRQRLALAKQLAQRAPALVKAVNAAGLGAHPRIVRELADAAWSAKLGGRL